MVNWADVERDYRAGMPLSNISNQHGVVLWQLLGEAKARGWTYGKSSQEKAPSRATEQPSEEIGYATDGLAREPAAECAPEQTVPGGDAPDVWDDARECYATGISLKEVAETFRLDPHELFGRIIREDWKPDLGMMLTERDRWRREPADLLAELDRSRKKPRHVCDECGEEVGRPVYCGRPCQQRAYRKRKGAKDAVDADRAGA